MAKSEATSGHYKLVKVGSLELEYESRAPRYSSIVVLSRDLLMVVDRLRYSLRLHNRRDGKCLAMLDEKEGPWNVCLVDRSALQVAVPLFGGKIKIVSVKFSGLSATINQERTLDVSRGFEFCHGVRALRLERKLVVCGMKEDCHCWGVVSLNDGSVSTTYKICKYGGCNHLATSADESIIYVSCFTALKSHNNGVYAFHIKEGRQVFTYRHADLSNPEGIAADSMGFIYVCNKTDPPCIHQITETGKAVKVHKEGIPSQPMAMYWDEIRGTMYVTNYDNKDIWSLRPEGSAVEGDEGNIQKSTECSEEEQLRQKYTYEQTHEEKSTSSQGENVDTAVADDSQIPSPHIPREILGMDEKSLHLYKESLQYGKEKVYNIRVMVVGNFGVGKTTLTKRLLEKQVDLSVWNSTEGIEVYKHCCNVSLNTGEWTVQPEDSDQLHRIQRLVKILTDADDTSVDISEQVERHCEVIDQREKTPIHYSDNGDSGHVKAEQSAPALKASRVGILQNGKHVTSKDDALMEFIQLANKNANKLHNTRMDYAALGMWDFAGQYIFNTTHQTFLTYRAIYLLVIDLSKQVTDHVTDDDCYLNIEGGKLCKIQELVEVWLNSIHCCAPSPAAGRPVTCDSHCTTETYPEDDTTVTPNDNDIPAVIVVGTHVDRVQEDKRQELDKYYQEIRHFLKDKPTLPHLVGFVAIDNTKHDPQLETLKDKIFQLASKQPNWGEEVPSNWLLLEQELMMLKASGKKVILLSLVQKLNQKAAVPIETDEELNLFLKFMHDIGTIIYFSVEGLKERIVLDPQWLIDAQKSIITADMFIEKNNPTIMNKWCEFREKGILTPELIDAVWTNEKYAELHDNKDHILLLLEQLNIIARARSFTVKGEKVENYFIAPCMLRQKSPRASISSEQDCKIVGTPVLCYVFKGKFLPPSIFHRLLAACVASWPVAKNKETSRNLIFCGYCVFDLDLLHRLTLRCRNHIVSARITRMLVDQSKIPDAKLCSRVGNFLSRNLSKIISCLGLNLQYDLCVRDVPKDGMVCFSPWFAAEVQDPDAPLKEEHMNYGRLCIALASVCSKALRKILKSHVPAAYPDIYKAIMAKRANLTSKKLLDMDQKQLVFPDPHNTGKVREFDISLLYKLIRNVSSLPEPATQWGKPPKDHPRDTTLGACVERIRLYRNMIHNKDGQIRQQEFEDIWNKIDNVLRDIEAALGTHIYTAELEKQRNQMITISEAC